MPQENRAERGMIHFHVPGDPEDPRAGKTNRGAMTGN